MRNDLLSLYLKYDSNFKTISKIALGELIVKIVYFAKLPVSIKYIIQQIRELSGGSVSDDLIIEAIGGLKGRIEKQNNKYVISKSYIKELDSAIAESERLHRSICEKYFSRTSSEIESVQKWFQQTTVSFFEKYNFEWIYMVANGKKSQTEVFDLDVILKNSFKDFSFTEEDKQWLSIQYKRFVTETDVEADSLFWQYGLSSFSARLICATSFANRINIDSFKGMTFLLDTNVLMILGLEKHKLNQSIALLENCFNDIGVKLEYLYVTQKEYQIAVNKKRQEVFRVFEEYDINVLSQSDCPFISTALHRQCRNGNDVNTMFDDINFVPSVFSSNMEITLYDDEQINKIVEESKNDNAIKDSLNRIYFKFKNRNKKEAALWHDAGLIGVTKYLRNQDEKYTILTNDNVMKMYASQNLKRNDIALAIGLDVMIRLLTVGGSGLSRDSSEFAPLFKNIIKSSLLPSKNAFQVEDLSFMLDAQLEINKLSNDKVVEIAKIVNQKLSAGEEEEKVNLYLRREIEGERLQNKTEIDQLKQSHDIVTQQRDDAVSQNKALMQSLREIERRKIKKNRKSRRIWSIIALVFIVVSLVVGELLIFKIEDKTLIWVLSPILTIALAFVSAFPFKYLTRKSNSEKDEDIDLEVENRIKGILNKDSSLINRS